MREERIRSKRVNEESQGVTLKPSRVVISETSAASDSQDGIRVMKTQMRSRWEIFENRRDKRSLERKRRTRRKDQVTKNQGDTSRGGRHSWHAECNVTRRCPYLFAIISARFHRSDHGAASRPGYTKVLCRHLRYRTAGRVHNNTSWNTSRHRPRRCENRSCVTTSIDVFSNEIESHDLSVFPLVSSVSLPRVS